MPETGLDHRSPPLTHERVWALIDAAARRNNLSASGLARAAGRDATSFNPGKRIGKDGRPRWPSTETVANIIAAVGEDVPTFFMCAGHGGSDARP